MSDVTVGERRFAAVAALCGAVVFFASIPVFLRYFAHFLDGWTVNGVRYGFAALFWLPYVLGHHREVPTGRSIWRDALRPAFVNVIGQTGWALSPYFSDAAVMSFVARSSFFFTVLFGFWLLEEERVLARRVSFWIGGMIMVVGLLVFYRGGIRLGATSPAGVTILLGTALCWGLYSVSVRKYMAGYDVRLSFGVISLYTAAGLEILMLVFGGWGDLVGLGWGEWGLLFAAAMMGIAFGHVLLYRAIQVLGPIVTEGGLLSIPFVTVTGAWFFLGERMGLSQWLGGAGIVAGSACLLVSRRGGSVSPLEEAEG